MVNRERPTTLSSRGAYLANQRHVKLQSPRHLLVKMNFHHNIFTESSQLKCRLLVMAILSRIQSSMTHINFFYNYCSQRGTVGVPASWYLLVSLHRNMKKFQSWETALKSTSWQRKEY